MFYLPQVENFLARKKVEEVLAGCAVGTLTYWNILHFNRRNASGWNKTDTGPGSWETRRASQGSKGKEMGFVAHF